MPEPLYRNILGAGFDALPPVTKALHSPMPERVFVGRAQIRRGRSVLARLVASWLKFPKTGDDVPARVTVSLEREAERLVRDYGGAIFESRQYSAQGPDGLRLMEAIGPIATRLRNEPRHDGLNLHAERAYWHGIPLPQWLTPQVTASERAYGGAHLFDVSVSLKFVGEVIAYRGRLVEQT
ncbi:DUF4166 domain-containing protein [Maricaulaceae bacterium NA33B04]|nr:DUF4166 domain-containing protein [Maricaulaceae bacterium NA33B04]